MASKSVSCLLVVTACAVVWSVSCFEFEVGGTEGWAVPPANDSKRYNDWASENRFRVGDSVHFRYRKGSVMAVTEEDYKNCNSTRPLFFSNTGNTVYSLNHSGPFYFISGVSGHCDKGQRMILKVMSSDESESGGGGSSQPSPSAASSTARAEVLLLLPAVLAVSVLVPYVLSRAVSVGF